MNNPVLLAILGNIIITIIILFTYYFISIFRSIIERKLKLLIAITAGIILGIVFMGFFPEISKEINNFYFFVLVGVMIFYFIEILLHFHHCNDLQDMGTKEDLHNSHYHLMFLGTFLHNFLHGLELVSSFAISINTGLLLTIIILAHSLPQNIANYLIQKDKKSIILASFGGVFSSILLLIPICGDFIITYKFHTLAITAGGLLYLSLSDIIPQINQKTSSIKEKVLIFIFILIGIIINILITFLLNLLIPLD